MTQFSTERGLIENIDGGEQIPPLMPAGDFKLEGEQHAARVETFFAAGGGYFARVDGGRLFRLNVFEFVIACTEADRMIAKHLDDSKLARRANGGSNAN